MPANIGYSLIDQIYYNDGKPLENFKKDPLGDTTRPTSAVTVENSIDFNAAPAFGKTNGKTKNSGKSGGDGLEGRMYREGKTRSATLKSPR